MFEYITKDGKKVTINPKMITVILEPENRNGCSIYTTDSPEPIIVENDYEKVRDDFYGFMYSINTIISVR